MEVATAFLPDSAQQPTTSWKDPTPGEVLRQALEELLGPRPPVASPVASLGWGPGLASALA